MTDFSISADFGRFSRMGMRVLGDRFLNIIPVRGRKQSLTIVIVNYLLLIVSKHYPRKGTETYHALQKRHAIYSLFLNIIPVRGRKPQK